jgi:hypothetical protein
MIGFTYNDGGRAAAGFKGTAGDCVVRAFAIAMREDYAAIYGSLKFLMRREDRSVGFQPYRSPREGVNTGALWFKNWIASKAWVWVPTMRIGSGARVHLRADELPGGRIVARVSRHVCAVIDGVVHDLYDPSREGTRCVYGYWRKARE